MGLGEKAPEGAGWSDSFDERFAFAPALADLVTGLLRLLQSGPSFQNGLVLGVDDLKVHWGGWN